MKELLLLLIIGLSLSIDAFGVSTVIGLYNPTIRKSILISSVVGIFHFFMPILGMIVTSSLISVTIIDTRFILGIVLIFISLQMLIECIKPSKKEISLRRLSIIFFAFGVSLDSFSVGLGLSALTENYILASTIFSICSFSLTLLGLTIGKYFNRALKNYSYLLSTVILFILGVLFLCKCL